MSNRLPVWASGGTHAGGFGAAGGVSQRPARKSVNVPPGSLSITRFGYRRTEMPRPASCSSTYSGVTATSAYPTSRPSERVSVHSAGPVLANPLPVLKLAGTHEANVGGTTGFSPQPPARMS